MRVYGVDFTSAPRRAKPIVVAACDFGGDGLFVEGLEKLLDFAAFDALLRRPGPWIGGFDFPFGLPREAVDDLQWPSTWRELTRHCAALGRSEFRNRLDRYRESRPPGKRYATRAGDAASGAHPSVKLVNPPVGLMFFEGAPRIAASNATVPCLCDGDPDRIALEAYPGLLVRRHLAIGEPYKNDQKSKQAAAHRQVRIRILQAVAAGIPHGIRVRFADDIESAAVEDASGDSLDAVLCALQAGWGLLQGGPRFGLPAQVDPVEGWIVSAR